ncbi:MAG: SRPBCC domain-containing protein [Pseudomonadota bacterium]
MKRYAVDTRIAAPPEVVWRVLVEDMPRDPAPFGIRRIEGSVARGGRLKLWSEVAPERAFRLRVATFEAPRKMVWQGGMPFGFFTGTRTFTIGAADGGSHFAMEEVFTGLLSGPITRSMPDLGPSFATFADALTRKAER